MHSHDWQFNDSLRYNKLESSKEKQKIGEKLEEESPQTIYIGPLVVWKCEVDTSFCTVLKFGEMTKQTATNK